MASCSDNSFATIQLRGNVDYDTDSFKVMLLTAS
jgi:hypothetical protein